jgi:hypothetical protein
MFFFLEQSPRGLVVIKEERGMMWARENKH